MTFEHWLEQRREFFNRHLVSFLPDNCPEQLAKAMEYSLLDGGKRLRPVLALTAARICGGQDKDALPAAVAVEMIHTYSLIHDDLPTMDDDDLRRGRPTCHKVFGEAMAILAGDALLTHAFAVVAQSHLSSGTIAAIVRELAVSAGPQGMVGGQVMDIAGAADLQEMYRLKTGALIRAAVLTGAMTAGATSQQLTALARYADALGMCYQLTDDILDVCGSQEATGKSMGSDARLGKETFVSLYGEARVAEMAARQAVEAEQALKALAGSSHVDKLVELAGYVARREQ